MAAVRKLSDRYSEADIDDEIVLMRLDNGELLSLADTGAAIWRLIDGQRDRLALAAELASEYDVEAEKISRDLDELIGQLKEAGLVAE